LEEEYRYYQVRLMVSNLTIFYVLFIILAMSFLTIELLYVQVIFYA